MSRGRPFAAGTASLDGRDGHGPAAAGVSARAVRVTLAPPSAHAGMDPCVTDVDAAGRPGPADLSGPAPTLRRLDAERAVLEAPGQNDRRLLVLPATSARAGAAGTRRQEVVVDGWRVEVDIESEARAALRARATRGRSEGGTSGPIEVRAMIPGVVLSVAVAAGDAVTAGQKVVVVEAMKMQNELRAPRDGTVDRIVVAAGARIEVGDLLLVIT